MSSSPTQRSLDHMRKLGYLCQVVEKFNSFCKIRQDLFGFIDIVAIKEGETVGIQTTTSEHMSERVKKINSSENFTSVKKANWKIVVHGWKKNKNGRWENKEEWL